MIAGLGFGRPRLATLGIEVRLGQLDAVDVDRAAPDCDRVAADPDDALDVRNPAALPVPRGRRVEDDHVTPGVRGEVGRQLVDEDALPGFEGVLHRLLLDAVRLGHEGLEGEEDDERQDQRLDGLVETAQRATAHSSAV